MASHMTTKGLFDILDRAVSGGSAADLRVLAVDTPPANAAAAANLNFVDDVVADELSGTGYARRTLTGEAAGEDDANDRANIDATDPTTYSAINAGTIAGLWLFRFVTDDTDSRLWGFLDVADIVTNGGDVSILINALGLLTAASA